jgi:hypothetical protein
VRAIVFRRGGEAFYFVLDGAVTLCDEDRKPTRHTRRLKPDDDPRSIAGMLKKAALGTTQSDFNRRINYQPWGLRRNLVRNGSSDQRPKIRSARANSKHTKPIVAAIKAISKRKRFLVMGAKYRCRAIRQLSLKVNLSDQH